MMQVVKDRHSVEVLQECIELQRSKGRDYQNELSDVQQADYYLSGFRTIYEMSHQKMLRLRSVMETAERGGGSPKHESLEDSCKDLINYLSFAVSFLRGKMEGQDPERDWLNRELPVKAPESLFNPGPYDAYREGDLTAAEAYPGSDPDNLPNWQTAQIRERS